jgi:hypothetical protein
MKEKDELQKKDLAPPNLLFFLLVHIKDDHDHHKQFESSLLKS